MSLEDEWNNFKTKGFDHNDIAVRDVCSLLRCRSEQAEAILDYATEKGYITLHQTNRGPRWSMKSARSQLLRRRWVNSDEIYSNQYREEGRAQVWRWKDERTPMDC